MDSVGATLADAVFCPGGCGRTFLVAVGFLSRYTCGACRALPKPAAERSSVRTGQPRRRLTDEQIRLALEEGANIRELAQRFGVSTGALYRHRRINRSVGIG